MDTSRVQAYLKVACAGLGFDVGEVWVTTKSQGSAGIAFGAEKSSDPRYIKTGEKVDVHKKNAHFLKLYTSKLYDNKRENLLLPRAEKSPSLVMDYSDDEAESNAKHVLSPRIVDAVCASMKVVWTNCPKQDGLLGRSDIRFQTAVGMPVAVDSNENICIVIMFSRINVQSNEDAMEFLRHISKSATSRSIPCLLPVVEDKLKSTSIEYNLDTSKAQNRTMFPEGVTARFVSFNENNGSKKTEMSNGSKATTVEVQSAHDLKAAPKDCFGIPMLPYFAELGGNTDDEGAYLVSASDVFDEASYGVWNEIMSNNNDLRPEEVKSSEDEITYSKENSELLMPQIKIDRLEEFASAFLDMSLFDIAEVWLPSSPDVFETLTHITTVAVSSIHTSVVNAFRNASSHTRIKVWSGAVGRAFGSGNPVWSSNPNVIFDSGRSKIFDEFKIKSILAVPIYSAGGIKPACVLSCYALLKIDSVPFVLRFVQQALRMLWEGLDMIVPNSSVNREKWKELNPSDLGEMAGDVELQKAFLVKKRPYEAMSYNTSINTDDNHDDQKTQNLSSHLQTFKIENNDSIHSESKPTTTRLLGNLSDSPYWSSMQNLRSIGETVLKTHHESVPTNAQGTKRAHMVIRCEQPTINQQEPMLRPSHQNTPNFHRTQPLNRIETVPRKPTLSHPIYDKSIIQPLPQAYASAESNTKDIVQSDPIYSHQPLQQTLSNTNGSNASGIGVFPHPDNVMMTHLDHSSIAVPGKRQSVLERMNNNHREDPNVAKRNIAEFNALAQMNTNRMQSNSRNKPKEEKPWSINVTPPFSTGTHFPASNSFQPMKQPEPKNYSQYCYPINSSKTLAPPARPSTTTKKICRIEGCNEGTAPRRPYCVRHSGNRLCEFPNCTKCAQGATRFCIAHGGGRRCTFPGCDKGARDKFFCAAHGGGKRCSHKGCNKSAVGGSSLCTSHGGGKRCCVAGCNKSAQSSTKFCVKHGGGKKCRFEGCEKVARGRTLYCAGHGGGVRCKLEGCNRVAVGKLQMCRTHGGGVRSRTTSPTRNDDSGLQS